MPSRAIFGFVPLFAAALAGCAFRTATPHVPSAIGDGAPPPARLQVAEVTVVERGAPASPEKAAAVRAEVARILADAGRKTETAGGAARVRVRVELGEHDDYASNALNRDGFAVFALAMLAPAGVKFTRQALAVDVDVDRAGRTLHGRGAADKEGSVYAPARKRALAVALDEALADAACDAHHPR